MNGQWNGVPLLIVLKGRPQAPVAAGPAIAQTLLNVLDQSGYIDDGVALEHLGQAVGQVADQAATGPLVQIEQKTQGLRGRVVAVVLQLDSVGTLVGIAEQGIEKLVGALCRKQFVQHRAGKDLIRLHCLLTPCSNGRQLWLCV
jgi:hypothetical protein